MGAESRVMSMARGRVRPSGCIRSCTQRNATQVSSHRRITINVHIHVSADSMDARTYMHVTWQPQKAASSLAPAPPHLASAKVISLVSLYLINFANAPFPL